MRIKLIEKIIFFLLITASIFHSVDVSAQKRNKKKKKDSKKEVKAEVKVVTAEDRRKAEMYHAEAEKYYILDDLPKAFVLYQRSLETDPANATAYYKIAQIYAKGNDLEKAAYNAQEAIRLDETNKYFYLLLADIYTKSSNFSGAADTYDQMISKCENTDQYLFELAAIYIYQENYDKALSTYDRIEETFGLNEQVIAQKQKIYLKQSNLELAIAEGQKLIDKYPGEPRYVLMLAEILISNNKYDEAIPYLENLLVDNPNNAPALLMLSDYYRNNGDVDKSNAYLDRAFSNSELGIEAKIQVLGTFMQKLPNEDLEPLAIDLGKKIKEADPDDPRAFEINGDLFMTLGKEKEALDDYKKAIELGASNFSTWQNVLQLELKNENFKAAIKYGDQAMELFPNQPGICWFLGNAYLADKDYEPAAEIFERGKKLSSANEELKSFFNAQLGDTYNSLKEYKKSDESYDAALAYDPDNDHVLNNYSYFLSLRKEKLDLAKKMSAKLVSRNPDDPTFLDTYAWVLYVRGEYAESKIYIEKAVEGSNPSGTIIEHYGDILYKLGDIDLAVQQWLRAKGMDETSELIDKKIADRKLYE